jgi:YidC/Oxa1 family membrane protein insertase
VLAVLAGLAQWAQAKSLVRQQPPKNAGDGAKDESMAAMMNKQMLYFMPILTAIIGIRFPAGLTLYWFLSTGLMVAQQLFMNRTTPKSGDTTKNNKPDVIEGKIVS